MSASATPTEKVFKSFLAAVLAISLCPLMPADKAQAEEAGDSAGPADAAQMSDEGLGGDADPTESALAADNSDADPELVGENNNAEGEGAPDDSDVALQTASDSGTPIVNWTKCGTCKWMIDASGCLTIKPANGESGSLENWDSRDWYPEEISPWRNYTHQIISVKIENGVIAKTTQRMFWKCSKVVSIDLAGLDTSEVADMRSMFSGCSSLASLDLSSLDTSSVTDMSGMFSGCSSLASLDLSGLDTSKVTDMSDMFCGCSRLSSLDLSGLDTSSVTSMSGMFYGCSSLKSLDLSSFDTSKVTSMYCMFQGCSSLASLDLSSFDTSNVISMCPEESSHYDEGMFSGCSSLSSLDLSSFDTSNVTGMDGMFSGCSKLAALDLSSFNTSNVKGYSGYHSMSEMFSGCSSLASLDLSSFDTSNVRDMTDMFYDCSKLASLDLSSFDTSNVTGMSRMFSGCSKLAALDLSSFNTSNVKGYSGFHRGMSEMFSGCSSLVNLDLSSFDTSNVRDMSRMFDGCLRLETLNLSSFNAGSVDDMGSMFEGCQSLKTILFPAVLNTPKVTNFSGMFSDCRSLEGLDVSGLDTSAAKSLSSMFSGCTKLASLDVSNFDTLAATSLSSMFYGCESLTSLDLSSFDTSAADYQYGLSWFMDGCKSLRTVTLGPKFSFEGAGLDRQCSLPTPEDNGLSGRWISSKDGIAYTSSGVPSNVAATYTAQEMGDTRAWNQNGTCIWNIDENGRLTVKPTTSESGELYSSCPWRDEKSRIKTVYFEKGVVAPKSMDSMFCDCKALISADLGNLDTSRATGVDNLFEGCSLLERVSLSNVDTSNVTSMVAMFSNCFSLKSLDLSSFDTSNVTSMRGMFNGCRAIESLDLSAFDTSSVTDMDLMFFSCYRLLDLDVSSFDTSNVRDMEDMFFDCRSLVSLDLSSFDTSSTTAMRSMFGGNCAIALLSVTFGEKFSFCGSSGSRLCALPSIISEGRTGLWVSSADGKAYAPDEIPNNVAATYTAQMKSEVPKTSISESMFAVDTRAKTYTGSPIKPSVSSGTLNKGTDYDVSYGENVNAGEGTVVITGTGDYVGQVTYAFRIDPKQVDAPKAAADLVYSGAEQVGVAPSDDYEVVGGSATNAGDYKAVASLKDKKNYVWAGKDGSDDVRVPWSIAKAVPSYSAPEPVDATLGQTLGGLELPGGFSWQDDPSTSVGNAGEHEFMAKFTPSDAANYNVVQNIPVIVRVSSPNLVAVPQVADLVYTGEFQKAAVPESDFYAVEEICGGIDAGAYEVKLSLKDSSSCRWADDGSNSEKTVTYRILPAQLTDVMITGVPARMEATGSQLTPKPIVTFNGDTLVLGADYSLSYGENVSPGKGSVTVTAIGGGNFTGSATVEFDIEKKAEPAPEPQQFAVIYHLDGGANAADNPATYMAGAAVPLADPTKEGFEFQGWYADAEFTVRVTEIPADASGDVELWAKWKEHKPAPVFTDVDYSSWYGDAVSYVASRGLITGYSGTTLFGVGDVLTRAQLATILWRNACPDEYASYDPETAKDTTGIDGSADGMYYTAAANWAVKNGVITGFDREDGSKDFAADDDVSFEQLITILSRLCATKEELDAAGSDLSAFADGDLASSWSRGAFAWAAARGLVQGYDEPTGKYLRPGDPVARERVAVVLMRAFEMGIMK